MTFEQILEGAEVLAQSGNPPVSGVAYDSRKVKPGFVFVAMKGESSDGNKFVDKAIASGAVAVVGGTPTLSLNDGGTATYTSGSGTHALNFSYTVAAGQDTPALAVTQVNLNGATVTNSIPVTVTGGSGQSLTDAQGHVWSFGAANGYGYAILRDGVQYAGGSGVTLSTDVNGVIWTRNSANTWYMVVATGWALQSAGPTLPTGGSGQAADLTGAVTTLTGLQIDTTTPVPTGPTGRGRLARARTSARRPARRTPPRSRRSRRYGPGRRPAPWCHPRA